ncbi:hypothetical protein [Cuspidothrix issatschenkoi]|uniref:Uncharacterized protein n=1 Tax=Cuspidothrix issatschenkoi CHARLIE-1 TaxID=2052836 RepID=A0A2S6CUJ1_9CYAN|nr:hypothetical protein [Cuspidothrix issatschenkoi]PPJ63361.1 hypothetical protein CUN59_10495 [Cuspidothrix issatschenkoi CHARLIE-1]
MLKIRTFLFALLGVSPLLFLSWQLPNQATVLPTNNNESATLSGYPTPIAQASPSSTFDSPSKGTAGSLSGGGTTGSSATVFSAPAININTAPPVGAPPVGASPVGASPVGASPSVSVFVSPAGIVNITVTPAATQAVNAAAASILSTAASSVAASSVAGGGQGVATVVALAVGGAEAQAAVTQLTSALSAAGVSPALVTTLLQNIAGLLSGTEVSITPSFPSAQLPQAQLVAGTKDLKASLTIAQTNTAPTVNINKLNNAINAYNQIILESSPVVLQKLAQDKDFLAIGQTLKTLRAALK